MIVNRPATQTNRFPMSDSTYIGVDLKLTGVFHAPGQTVVIAGRFEGEMTAG